eukprot:gene6262-6982_t
MKERTFETTQGYPLITAQGYPGHGNDVMLEGTIWLAQKSPPTENRRLCEFRSEFRDELTPREEDASQQQQTEHQSLNGTDNEDGSIARFPLRFQLSLTEVMEEDNRRYLGLTNANNIKEVVASMELLGDQIEAEYDEIWKQKFVEPEQRTLFEQGIVKFNTAKETVGILLDYLENMGDQMLNDVKTTEGVLRGILNFSELAFQLEIFTYLKFVVKCIDVPEDPFKADRTFIIKSLDGIDQMAIDISKLIEEEQVILTRIIQDGGLDMTKAMEFDDVIRRANLKLSFCKRRLDNVEPVIEKLLHKASTVKWFSRGVRLFCLGLTWSYMYGKWKESEMSLSVAVGGGVASGFMWLALFPSNSYKLYESLQMLQGRIQLINNRLEEIHQRMESDKYHMEQVVQNNV